MRSISNFAFAVLSVSIMGGCFNAPTYPIGPQIEILNDEICFLKSTKVDVQDELVVSLKFKDGDGDLGLAQQDTVGKYVFRSFFTFQNKLVTYKTKKLNPTLQGTNGQPLPDYVSPFNCKNWTVERVGGVRDTFYVEYNEYYFNIFVDIETQNQDGSFTKFDPAAYFQPPSCDTKGFNGRFPVLSKDPSKSNPLDGKMTYSMRSFGLDFLFSTKTLRLKISIVDKALNKSNVVESKTFTLQSVKKCSQ